MIPRSQRVLLWLLLVASAVMAVYLIRMRERAADRLDAAATSGPLTPPGALEATGVTLLVASDLDGSLVNTADRLPLPSEPHARARYLLNHLLARYARPGSAHPIASSAGVNQVYLMPVPGGQAGDRMAIVDLSGSLLEAHPSGIETETLTLLSLIGTLHANLPEVTEVRFLVDGEARATLAGHADLMRTYLAAGAAPSSPPQ